MSKELITSIEIAATPDKVWQVLTDFENYPAWNPFIKSIKGEKEVGKQLETEISPPNRKPMKFKPIILKFDEKQELRWIGKLMMKGIFDGEHYFKITPIENGKIIFEQGEKFGGILVGFMPKVLIDTKLGFQQMNAALKTICER